MNFFEQQDRARKNSGYLILLLCLAVLCLIGATTALVAGLLYYFSDHAQTISYQSLDGVTNSSILSWKLLASIALSVGLVVLLGSLFRLNQLRGGGPVVAESMGGRLLNTDSRNTAEKRLLNVVEEMAIASGTPVPPVYLLDDPSINAFAAGYKASDAVIGVTQGCIEQLDRDQLQGVIAHEFSHILHGDMRINLRLVGILHGILAIGLIGELLLRGSHRPYRAGYSYRPNRGKGSAAILGAGIGLVILGYAGSFFGNLIKAAVSRQREYLADASAVQYTRNPEGISGALKRIGGFSGGTKLHNGNASEFSHMYFCQGISTAFNALMATHPPLDHRIQRIQPNWQGDYVTEKVTEKPSHEVHRTTTEERVSQLAGTHSMAAPQTETANPTRSEQSLEQSIGNPSDAHLDHARNLLNSIPEDLKSAAHEPFSSRALIYGLLLDKNPEKANHQRSLLKAQAHPVTFKHFEQLAQKVQALAPELCLPLVELALPALKQQSPGQYSVFKKAVIKMIKADKKVSLGEWALYRILTQNLEPSSPANGRLGIKDCQRQCQNLFAALAIAGHTDSKPQEQALAQAGNVLGLELAFSEKKPTLNDLDASIEMLKLIKPLQKPKLLKALMACIQADGQVTIKEAELFRAIADSLDCPVPPLL